MPGWMLGTYFIFFRKCTGCVCPEYIPHARHIIYKKNAPMKSRVAMKYIFRDKQWGPDVVLSLL